MTSRASWHAGVKLSERLQIDGPRHGQYSPLEPYSAPYGTRPAPHLWLGSNMDSVYLPQARQPDQFLLRSSTGTRRKRLSFATPSAEA